MAAEGGIRPRKRRGSPIWLPRTEVERIAAAVPQSMLFEAVVTHFGIGVRAVRAIREADLLPVWDHGGYSNRHRYLFVKPDVDCWVKSVVGDLVDVEALAPRESAVVDVNRPMQMPF